MGAIARLGEQELGPPGDDLFAERDEQGQQILQGHHLRTAGVEGHHVGAETGLQRREPVELVEHHVGNGVAFQFHHHPIAVAVGLVAQVGDALDLLFAHQVGDALDHGGLVHLVGNFRDDDRFTVLADGVDRHLAAHHDRAATEMIRRTDALAAQNDAAGREIRAGNDVDEVVDAERRILDQRDAGIDHLAEIVRRDVGRHADRNAAGPVDQQIGKARRQHRGLALGIVVVALEIDGVLVDVVKQGVRDLGETGFRVTHRGGGIAIDRTEIALPVDQRQAHGEILRHTHQRVIDRLVAVRVIFTHHVADGAGRLAERLVPVEAVLVHRVEDAPMHRLQTVARIRKRARHDHAHRVIEVGPLHLISDRNRTNVDGFVRTRIRIVLVSQTNKSPNRISSEYIGDSTGRTNPFRNFLASKNCN